MRATKKVHGMSDDQENGEERGTEKVNNMLHEAVDMSKNIK